MVDGVVCTPSKSAFPSSWQHYSGCQHRGRRSLVVWEVLAVVIAFTLGGLTPAAGMEDRAVHTGGKD